MKAISEVIIFCLSEVAGVVAKNLVGYVNYGSQSEIDRICIGDRNGRKQKRK